MSVWPKQKFERDLPVHTGDCRADIDYLELTRVRFGCVLSTYLRCPGGSNVDHSVTTHVSGKIQVWCDEENVNTRAMPDPLSTVKSGQDSWKSLETH